MSETESLVYATSHFKVLLPLDPYERILLEDAAAVFGFEKEGSIANKPDKVLGFSHWAQDVRYAILALIVDGDITTGNGEEMQKRWGRFISHFGGLEGKRSRFREKLFDNFNPNSRDILQVCERTCTSLKQIYFLHSKAPERDIKELFHDFHVHSDQDIVEGYPLDSTGGLNWALLPLVDHVARKMVEPVPDDLVYWEIFAELLVLLKGSTVFDDEFESPFGKKVTTGVKWAQDDGTYPVWRLIKEAAIARRSHGKNARYVRSFLKVLDSANKYEGNAPHTALEYIPWDEIQLLNDPYEYDGDLLPRFLWAPSVKTKFEYRLFTEEDVFRYCILNDFTFPESTLGGHTVFVARDWRESGLASELHQYVSVWNDCAITQDPAGDWKVLETIPGLKFRQLYKASDVFATHRFSSICEQHRMGTGNALKEAMGALYNKNLEFLLSPIPFGTLEMSNVSKLGSGARGTVFRTYWCRQPSITNPQEERIPVALKAALPERGSQSELRDYLLSKELQNSTLTQQGLGTGVIKLFGVTRSPKDLRHNLLPPDTLFMVLECAKLGTLRQYLKNQLDGSESDWQTIHEASLGLAVGLHQLHKAGYVHRDIHWDNLLVTRHETPNDPKVSDTLVVLVSDLGEARRTSDVDAWVGARSYNNHEFRPPSPFDINTHAADIWSMGSLVLGMIIMHRELATAAAGGSDIEQRSIPECFLNIINKCLVDDPSCVPDAWDAVQILEDCKYNDDDKIIFNMIPYEERTGSFTEAADTPDKDSDDEIVY